MQFEIGVFFCFHCIISYLSRSKPSSMQLKQTDSSSVLQCAASVQIKPLPLVLTAQKVPPCATSLWPVQALSSVPIERRVELQHWILINVFWFNYIHPDELLPADWTYMHDASLTRLHHVTIIMLHCISEMNNLLEKQTSSLAEALWGGKQFPS